MSDWQKNTTSWLQAVEAHQAKRVPELMQITGTNFSVSPELLATYVEALAWRLTVEPLLRKLMADVQVGQYEEFDPCEDCRALYDELRAVLAEGEKR